MGNDRENSRTSEKILCVIPMDQIDRALVSAVAEEAGSSMGFAVVISPAVSLDKSAYDHRSSQYSSTRLLESLRSVVRKGMLHIAITDVDLSYPGLNCVFGLADDAYPLAVVSVARLAGRGRTPAGRDKTAERAVKTAIHELGHLVGLPHCSDHRCVMFFSFTLRDTDYKSKDFCLVCKKGLEAKLQGN